MTFMQVLQSPFVAVLYLNEPAWSVNKQWLTSKIAAPKMLMATFM